MRTKQVIPRLVAEDDLENAFNYYLDTGGARVAERFATDFQRTIEQIARFPALGSPRHGIEHRLDDLRCWPLKEFPYLIFYKELERFIDVWRVLHSHMDIPRQLEDVD